MGREIKRVAIEFNWPLNMQWKGYMNPYSSQECKVCKGKGYSSEAQKLHNEWYGMDAVFNPEHPYDSSHPIIRERAKKNSRNSSEWAIMNEAKRLAEHFNSWSHHLSQEDVDALLKADRLWDFTRVPITPEQQEVLKQKGGGWLPFNNGYHPAAKEVNEWSLKGIGHDSYNALICVRAKCERLNISVECPICEGHGSIWFSDKVKQLAEDWYENERYHPPEGEGWQLWETVSEGSPVSPVFRTPEQLAHYLVANSGSLYSNIDYNGWLKFITEQGWATGGAIINGQIMTGVEAIINSGADHDN